MLGCKARNSTILHVSQEMDLKTELIKIIKRQVAITRSADVLSADGLGSQEVVVVSIIVEDVVAVVVLVMGYFSKFSMEIALQGLEYVLTVPLEPHISDLLMIGGLFDGLEITLTMKVWNSVTSKKMTEQDTVGVIAMTVERM